MKAVLGIAMVVVGCLLGAYVGVWVCFIGGIVDVIEQIRAEHLQAMAVAIGIAKVIFAGFLGTLSACFLVVPGMAMVNSA